MKSKLILLLVAVLSIVAVIAGTVLAQDRPVEGRKLWESQDITSYRFVLSRNCFCPIRGPVVIEVRDGEAISIVDQETGKSTVDGFPLTDIFGDVDTIDKLFAVIEDAEGAAVLRVTYDEALGYPAEIYIDQSELMADEEIGYVVHSLEILD
jgi:hypothetical protein